MRWKVTNYDRIALQIGLNCSYSAPIAKNEEKFLVRMLTFRPDRDFIVFLYIFIYELMKWKYEVEID